MADGRRYELWLQTASLMCQIHNAIKNKDSPAKKPYHFHPDREEFEARVIENLEREGVVGLDSGKLESLANAWAGPKKEDQP